MKNKLILLLIISILLSSYAYATDQQGKIQISIISNNISNNQTMENESINIPTAFIIKNPQLYSFIILRDYAKSLFNKILSKFKQ